MAKALSAVLFDLYGTLLDVHSIAVRADQLFAGRGAALSQLWRDKSIEYTRLRTMSNRYVPFTQVVEDALQYACDALHLPLRSEHFDLVTSAFGFRNLADYDAGLREILRVLRPGGECGLLDFGEPGGVMGAFYRIYFKQVLPRVGTMISGVRGPYAYLPASVERFPRPEEMLARMKNAGFSEATWTPYTFGIAGLYRGKK